MKNETTGSLLNEVAKMLFESTGSMPDKSTVISVAIGGLVKLQGLTYEKAYDTVLGAGAYAKLVSDLHEEFKIA
jgi:hypothetical protein